MPFKIRRSAAAPALYSGLAQAQSGHIMNGRGSYGGWMGGDWMGGYSGAWIAILLLVIVGLLVWIVIQRRK